MSESENSKNKLSKSLRSEIASYVIIILFAFSVKILCLELFHVPTPSMNETILEGDYIFSTKYDYGYSIYSIPFNPNIFKGRIFKKEPKRGDVIIMRPPHNMDIRYVKRLIALPGEKIQIINDVTYINDIPATRVKVGESKNKSGQVLIKYKETFPDGASFFSYKMKYQDYDSRIDRSNYGPYIVEEGRYFFMGDNRDNSGDSRYQLGTVPIENFIAKGRFVIFSTEIQLFDSNLSLLDQIKRFPKWIASIRFKRLFTNLYSIN